ncbi:unnamed protein product [Gemmata massiliana]|uniref:Uncharacterized protein n=1 Tax=Gemmata massiliana TaxID=1210884 RepID=A0A6P2D1Y4_9BACT|nr:hypothetical protein [Gemmata massiliana]VTR94104.1 unnamed protein product [Gemmata massiliana]
MKRTRFQLGEVISPKDNRHKAVLRELETHRKCRFYLDFYAKYKAQFHLPDLSPSEGASKPLRSQEQEQEQEQELNTPLPPAHAGDGSIASDQSPKAPKRPRPSKANEPWADCLPFHAFYAAFPNKQNKPAAWKAWVKLDPNDALAADVMAGLERYKVQKETWREWKQPGPWLNARMWEDFPEMPATIAFQPVVKKPTDIPMLNPERLQQDCPPMEAINVPA